MNSAILVGAVLDRPGESADDVTARLWAHATEFDAATRPQDWAEYVDATPVRSITAPAASIQSRSDERERGNWSPGDGHAGHLFTDDGPLALEINVRGVAGSIWSACRWSAQNSRLRLSLSC